jgi:hypothetical protein
MNGVGGGGAQPQQTVVASQAVPVAVHSSDGREVATRSCNGAVTVDVRRPRQRHLGMRTAGRESPPQASVARGRAKELRGARP